MTFSLEQAMIEFFSGNQGSYWGTGQTGGITGTPTGGSVGGTPNGGSGGFDWASEIPEGTYIDMEVVGNPNGPDIPEEWRQVWISDHPSFVGNDNFFYYDRDGRIKGGNLHYANPHEDPFKQVPVDSTGLALPGMWTINGKTVAIIRIDTAFDPYAEYTGPIDPSDLYDRFDENGLPLDADGSHVPGEWLVNGQTIVVAEPMVFHVGDSSDESDADDTEYQDEATVSEGGVPVVRGPMIIFDLTNDTVTVVGHEDEEEYEYEEDEEDAPVQPEMRFEIVDAPLSSALNEGKGAYVQLGASVRMQNIRFVDDHTGQERVGSFSLDAPSGSTTRVTVGTSGHDSISGSGWLMGADGNDTLTGGANADLILGGDGNDMIAGGAGADTLNGGKGNDTLDYGADTVGIYADLRTGSAFHGLAEGDRIIDVENVVGGTGRDTIYGSADANVLNGQAGDDIMAGAGGNDSLYGGNGNDTLHGDDGNDVVAGGDGNDIVRGGAGADILDGGAGIDTLDYGSAASGVYVDIRTGAAFHGDAAGDVIGNFENVLGGSGHDTLYGSDGANELNGQAGDDLIGGGAGNDTLWGGAGHDALYGDDGNDYVAGGSGNDVIQGGAGADTLDGGEGVDTLVYGGADGALVDLRTGYTAGQAAGDVISGFENVVGGSGNDTVYGSSDANELNGQGGNDILAGADGNDTLWGAAGNDWLEGGNGNDLLAGGTGDDRLVGGAGNDALHGEAGRDVFVFESTLNAATNVDWIADFSVAEDWIGLSRSVFGGFGASVALAVGAGATAATAQVVYDSATGALSYDADGTGGLAQVKFAQLSAGLALSAANFVLI